MRDSVRAAADGLLGVFAEEDATAVLDAFAPHLAGSWSTLTRIVAAQLAQGPAS